MAAGRVTIKDVAQKAGVSVATVSRVLNGTGRFDKATQDRIQEIVEELGYRPSMAAQSLRTQKSRNIMLVVPDITNPFYSSIARFLQTYVKEKNYVLTLYNTNEELQEELTAIATAHESGAGGILFASVNNHPYILEKLRSVNVPTVLMNSFDACEFDTVHGRRNYGTYLSAQHLIQQGHRRIAFAGGSRDTTIGRSRKNGYERAMQEADIPIDESMVFEMGFSESAGYKAGKYFSTLSPLPTAICCANDSIALGVLSALREIGLKTPEEISVTGMDDVSYAKICCPPLTSVTNDSESFAKKAFDLLFDRIDNGYDGEAREVIVDRKLIVRESVKALNT